MFNVPQHGDIGSELASTHVNYWVWTFLKNRNQPASKIVKKAECLIMIITREPIYS